MKAVSVLEDTRSGEQVDEANQEQSDVQIINQPKLTQSTEAVLIQVETMPMAKMSRIRLSYRLMTELGRLRFPEASGSDMIERKFVRFTE